MTAALLAWSRHSSEHRRDFRAGASNHGAAVLVLAFAVVVTCAGCSKKPDVAAVENWPGESSQNAASVPPADSQPGDATPKSPQLKTRAVRQVTAAWYDVPGDSLAKRRAGVDELTAAHNHLPIGTLVRVTHLHNGKTVLVRITDRGIRDKRAKIDLCREAAEQLGMVAEGMAKVRMEILGKDNKPAAAGPTEAAMQP